MKKGLLILIGFLLLAFGFLYLVMVAESKKITLPPPETPLDAISPDLVDVMVTVEDKRFYHHNGIDPLGILRAGLYAIRDGELTQGGSTITQQVAKNVFLTNEQTAKRKGKEMWLALLLEMRYSKEEILESYFNVIYFGEGATGIKEAANVYFGKEPASITFEEAVVLSGLPQAPSAYNPYENMEAMEERREVVLGMLADEGVLSKEEANRIASTAIHLQR